MSIFTVLSLLGGVGLFLYGIHVMSGGLSKLAGGKLERVLERFTNTRIKGVLLGAAVTAAIQSSAATTVTMVGFVNSGIMQLQQAAGVIFGANIGTTITAWLLSLTAISGDSLVLQMLKPDSFVPLVAIIGASMLLFSKKRKRQDIGTILIGFAVLMYGMSAMSGAVAPLAKEPWFADVLLMFSNPLLGILLGLVLTAVLQSSSASIGILQALSASGAVTYGIAFPILIGQNIGSCVTTLISCIGANIDAKRAALVHLYFNVLGSVLFLVIFYAADAAFSHAFINEKANVVSIAVLHSAFNIATTLVLLPFIDQICKLATLSVRSRSEERQAPLLDERFLNTPAFAVEQCRKATIAMAEIAKESLFNSFSLFTDGFREEVCQLIEEEEKRVDSYEDQLNSYLIRLSSKELSESDSRDVSKLLHIIGEIERLSDHALNISEVARSIQESEGDFSSDAHADIGVIIAALKEALTITVDAFETNDSALAAHVEPLEQVIDSLRNDIKLRHILRLRIGRCTVEHGIQLEDLIIFFERVSDHCSNIAVAIIQLDDYSLDVHEYNQKIRSSDPAFQAEYQKMLEKYALPEVSYQRPIASAQIGDGLSSLS